MESKKFGRRPSPSFLNPVDRGVDGLQPLLQAKTSRVHLRELEEGETKRRTGMTEAEWQVAIGPYIQQLVASGNYPYLARYVAENEDRDIGESFTFGLDCLLDGIAAYIAKHRQ